ncbi:MAG: hypothetical protein HOG18_02545 [Proteobacteria bacterium]|jgi:cell division protein FtsB|nr:hypothetical protein [Pseudomonadota bacterium]MDB4825855.1 hypothetical protein [Gammaproteobacteria bacterium]MBT4107809.1 hypothetical protein [Pseudomonadota bacterium]MBT4356445.1 hypothetical protein [Pseudomonadota bacterium]MBT5189140.1 hypothetical protein [Pseudomonadota bacterium]
MNNRNQRYARKILIQFLVLAVTIIFVAIWQQDFLYAVYAENQVTQVGVFINGGIGLLFFAGIYQIVREFKRLESEETALNQTLSNLENKNAALEGVSAESLIANRYETLVDLHQQHAVINHSALAATVVALESSRVSFPKFVHNVLILTGVFGTVVSLSIALLGASDVIVSTTETGGLGMIIHGMSTALSTTMTAIFAYLFFGYFYLRLMDAQTHMVSSLESSTTRILLPMFQIEPEKAAEQLSQIVKTAAALVERLDQSQASYAEVAADLRNLFVSYRDEMQRNSDGLTKMTKVLREGFRLDESDN